MFSGHNYQRPHLPLYLPGNGGLLDAIAMTAGGCENSNKRNSLGFPPDWKVKVENLNFNVLSKI